MRPEGFLIVFFVPLSIIAGYFLGGIYTFLTPVLVFGLIPILDLIAGRYSKNPGPDQEKGLEESLIFRRITWACLPVQLGMVTWGAWIIANRPLSPLEMLGLAVSIGINSGVMGINVSHELIHRVNNRLEPLMGRMMLASVLYTHWAIEHIAGHHRNVATPGDPATARLGESFWRFLPRTVKGGFADAWRIEAARMARKNLAEWDPRNRVVLYTAAHLGILAAVFALFGIKGVIYWLVQAAVAVWLLEIVNFVEHYGLLRQKKPDGGYEPVQPVHSWNASNRLTNHFLFNLQRHSDHHYRPGRRYQLLRHFDQSPQLPTGYAGMLVLAAVPPLWRAVMDERVRRFNALGQT
jgi:alkane 1-monooxygenase